MNQAGPVRPSERWRFSLRSSGVAVLAVLIVAYLAVLFVVYRQQEASLAAGEDVERAYLLRSSLEDLRGSLLEARDALAAHTPGEDAGSLSAFEAARRKAGQAQSRLLASGGAAGLPLLEEIVHGTAAVMDVFDLARASRDPAVPRRVDGALEELAERITRLAAEEDARFAQARAARAARHERFVRILIALAVLGPLGTLLAHALVAGRVSRRLRAVEENARRLAQGLPLEASPPGGDEIAALGHRLEIAAHLLRGQERDLRESEARYRNLFDHAPVPYLETDSNGIVRSVNQAVCTLLRSAPAQLIGCSVFDLASGDNSEALRAARLERIAAGRGGEPFETELQLAGGQHITVEIRENQLYNARGEIAGSIRSLVDVTERNMAAVAARKVAQYAIELRIKNEQLARALDAARSATVAKSRFLASVSHELRTPLNGIIGFSELLVDRKLGPLAPGQRDVLDDILSSARHLLRLIDGILDLSKVEAGRMEFRPERHRLLDLVEGVRDVIRLPAEKKGLSIALDVPPEMYALLDGARFKQVVYNYLSNAVKFTPEGGSIQVRVRPDGAERFRLEVEDTGCGIEEEELQRLFQEFGQLPGIRRAGQGTGLGLALTRHLVEAQGGSVTVDSRPGRGSIFAAVLPLTSKVSGEGE